MRSSFLLALLCILMPIVGHAQVMFSEIAWMGTDTDANDEWIELYNFSETDTDITGWTITLDDAPFISLTGSIPPHGVIVLERTDDNALPTPAFQIYTGALPNTGGTLKIRDLSDTVSDEAEGGTDWSGIGGSNTVPKMTPQRTRTGTWVTGLPTPGVDNVQEDVPIVQDDIKDVTVTETSKSKSSGGGGSVKKTARKELEIPILKMTTNAPKIGYVNQEIFFEAIATGIGKTLLNSLDYTWNFGDTYIAKGKSPSHIFEFPGEYVVVTQAEFAKQSAMVRSEITILPVSITLTRTTSGDILLKNNSKNEVDLGGYLITAGSSFMLPKFTILKPDGVLTIGARRIDAQVGSAVVLRDALGMILASDVVSYTEPEKMLLTTKTLSQKTISTVSRLSQKSGTGMIEEKKMGDEKNGSISIASETAPTVIAIGKTNTEDVDDSRSLFKRALLGIFTFFGM